MVKRYLFCLMIVILFLPFVYAADYYADVEVEIDRAGFAYILGDTNYLDLLTEKTDQYTSKKQSYWLFEISTEDVFSDYFVLLRLPEGASVNYVKSSGNFRIENIGNRIAIKVFGQDEKISIKAQYQINDYKKSNAGLIITLSTAIIIGTGVFLYLAIRKKKSRVKKVKEAKYDFSDLTSRQKKIMDILIEKRGPMTQAEIEKNMKLPKSSVSRNIRTLELKGRIEKEKAGISNIIRIKKE